jgi:AraC-like DNA-binding protein
MPCSGTRTFTDPEEYQASFLAGRIELVFTSSEAFTSRLTTVRLPHLQLVRAEESLPRIAYLALHSGPALVSFATPCDPRPIWAGLERGSDEVVFHSRGERSHERTAGPCRLNFIALAPGFLTACGKAVTGHELAVPPTGRVLCPSRSAVTQLRRIHAKACRLAETNPEVLAHPEAARSLEQELLHRLLSCLSENEGRRRTARWLRHADTIVRFEEVLAAHIERPSSVPELCALLQVPERTLRICCTEILGLSPGRYLRLRRLNRARAELRRADPSVTNVGEIARRFQFTELGRFAVTYRSVFGETPSATLHRRSKYAEFA